VAQREGSGPEPTVIGFLPAAGGVGNSKLAVEVGVSLKTSRATRGRRVALIDLDFQTSHVCSYLDIEPKFRVEEIAQDPERLDAQMFDIFRSQHGSGLDVIAAPRSKFRVDDLSIDALDALFDMAANRYDLILIDLPVTWFNWTADIVANSDALVVTGINTIPCLHQVAEALAAIRSGRTDAVPISVVINRCESSMFGGVARQKHVQRALGKEKIFYIRDHAGAMTQTVNTGTPLVSGYGGRKAAGDIAPLARFCAEVKSLRAAAQSKVESVKGRGRPAKTRLLR
jgi:pilus assembly protein CpaE